MYTDTGKIGFRCPSDVNNKYLWIACWPLMNAHILGCVIDEPERWTYFWKDSARSGAGL